MDRQACWKEAEAGSSGSGEALDGVPDEATRRWYGRETFGSSGCAACRGAERWRLPEHGRVPLRGRLFG
jgi:hypothetical protein